MSVTKFPAIRRCKQGYLILKHKFGDYEISLFSNNDDPWVSVVVKAYGHSFIRVRRKKEKFARCVAFDKLRSMIITAAHSMVRLEENSKVIEAGYKALTRNIMRIQHQIQKVKRKEYSDDAEMREWAELVMPKLQEKLKQKESMLAEFKCHPRIAISKFKDVESANS